MFVSHHRIINNYNQILIYWNNQCHVRFCDECTKLQKYGFRFIYVYESMYWLLSFKLGNKKLKMCPIRRLISNISSVETMFWEEVLARFYCKERKKKYFVTFQERKWHSNVPLGAVHELCRLGRGGEGGSPKDDLLQRSYFPT